MTTPQQIHHQLQDDFPFYVKHAPLYIKDKRGVVIKWELNQAQLHIHQKLEAQLKEKGWVRALILKGRQQGASTYVEGRNYHKTTRNHGRDARCAAYPSRHAADNSLANF